MFGKLLQWLNFKKNIDTPRLVLRQLSQKDIPAVEEYANNPLSIQYLLWEKASELYFSGENIANFCTPTPGIYAIALKDNNLCIGNIDLTIRNKSASCFYMINPAYCSKGYATEALTTLIAFCFAHLGLNKITAAHFAENPASGRVMQKSGMLHQKTVPAEMLVRGKHRDIVHYSITYQIWQEQAKTPSSFPA